MTHLSRIRLNPLRNETRKMLASPQVMHAAVLGGIPDQPLAERTLWRLDADNPRRPMLFVLTRTKPDWTHLVENAGWPDADGEHAAVRDYTPLLGQLARGRRFAFRLTANPTENTFTPRSPTAIQAARSARGDRRAHRLPVKRPEDQLRWFLDRTERWGFGVPDAFTTDPILVLGAEPGPPPPDVRITRRQRLSFSKNGGRHSLTIHTATFEGILEVSDPRVLAEKLIGGIGPAKGYGCGLLTLAPPARGD